MNPKITIEAIPDGNIALEVRGFRDPEHAALTLRKALLAVEEQAYAKKLEVMAQLAAAQRLPMTAQQELDQLLNQRQQYGIPAAGS